MLYTAGKDEHCHDCNEIECRCGKSSGPIAEPAGYLSQFQKLPMDWEPPKKTRRRRGQRRATSTFFH